MLKFLTTAYFAILTFNGSNQSSCNGLVLLKSPHVYTCLAKFCLIEDLLTLSKVSKDLAKIYKDLMIIGSDGNLWKIWSFTNSEERLGFLQRCFDIAPKKMVSWLEGGNGHSQLKKEFLERVMQVSLYDDFYVNIRFSELRPLICETPIQMILLEEFNNSNLLELLDLCLCKGNALKQLKPIEQRGYKFHMLELLVQTCRDHEQLLDMVKLFVKHGVGLGKPSEDLASGIWLLHLVSYARHHPDLYELVEIFLVAIRKYGRPLSVKLWRSNIIREVERHPDYEKISELIFNFLH